MKRSAASTGWLPAASTFFCLATLAACGSSDDSPAPAPVAPAPPVTAPVLLTCTETVKTQFKPDAATTVVLVKAFKKGDALTLAATPGNAPLAASDVCMVKLLVGPGNPGPADAPSTSAGIGIEVWLPAASAWNGRVHAIGGAGWQGGAAGSATALGGTAAAAIAGVEGAVSSITDTGHTVGNGTFAMRPDGTINDTLWTDFASRAIHEQAVKTKALAASFYGSAPKKSYWDGGSTGGRQGLNLAQNNPADFDGIVANYPAINWTRFITGELYPQIVYQRDLGGVGLTSAQLTLASNAAIAACDVVGGKHLGYILDPSACSYDPALDVAVLCPADGGTNDTAACFSKRQAGALNKIWYGMTSDGTAPLPAADNGWPGAFTAALIGSGNQRYFGNPRGTNLSALSNANAPFVIAPDMIALELQNPAMGEPGFINATGNGLRLWKELSYGGLSNAYDRGVALQKSFGNVNTDSADLSAFSARGGKLLTWHGLADELIPPQATVNYYHRVAAQTGSFASTQAFYRLYLAPGLGHGDPNGTSNPSAAPPNFTPTQIYDALTAWVENGTAPGALTLQSTAAGVTKTRQVCVYPQKVTYVSGDVNTAASYTCN
jgi:feruloyl esterase